MTVDLDALRQKLIAYLDDYAKEYPFSDSDRPLELKNLHVVALVQNDDRGAVLQARQVEVTGELAEQERQTKEFHDQGTVRRPSGWCGNGLGGDWGPGGPCPSRGQHTRPF